MSTKNIYNEYLLCKNGFDSDYAKLKEIYKSVHGRMTEELNSRERKVKELKKIIAENGSNVSGRLAKQEIERIDEIKIGPTEAERELFNEILTEAGESIEELLKLKIKFKKEYSEEKKALDDMRLEVCASEDTTLMPRWIKSISKDFESL